MITALRPIVLAWLKTVLALDAEPPRALDHRRRRVGGSLGTFVTSMRAVAHRDDVGERAADVDAEHPLALS